MLSERYLQEEEFIRQFLSFKRKDLNLFSENTKKDKNASTRKNQGVNN